MRFNRKIKNKKGLMLPIVMVMIIILHILYIAVAKYNSVAIRKHRDFQLAARTNIQLTLVKMQQDEKVKEFEYLYIPEVEENLKLQRDSILNFYHANLLDKEILSTDDGIVIYQDGSEILVMLQTIILNEESLIFTKNNFPSDTDVKILAKNYDAYDLAEQNIKEKLINFEQVLLNRNYKLLRKSRNFANEFTWDAYKNLPRSYQLDNGLMYLTYSRPYTTSIYPDKNQINWQARIDLDERATPIYREWKAQAYPYSVIATYWLYTNN